MNKLVCSECHELVDTWTEAREHEKVCVSTRRGHLRVRSAESTRWTPIITGYTREQADELLQRLLAKLRG